MTQTKEVEPAHSNRHTRAESGGTGRRVERCCAPSDPRKFGAHAEVERIAASFIHVEQDILAIFLTIGILKGSLYLRKDSQVIEFLLDLRNTALRNCIASRQTAKDSVCNKVRICRL